MPRVLSVGQCGADHASISYTLRANFEAEVVGVDSTDEALELLRAGGFALVLVNRVFDLDGSNGLDAISTLIAASKGIPVMLVSNYEDAQSEAEALGAKPGFGKAALGRPQMLERVRPYLTA